eukprot:gene5926-6166_t
MGYRPMMFITTAEASNGGINCSSSNGFLVYIQCINNNACPWDDVHLPDSPAVLPPVNASLNDSDVHIKGGNVTISGVKIEGANGFSSGAASNNVSGSSSFNGSSASGNGSQALKPHICQFNGSLAFYTFGVVVDVLGEFQLQRGMSWTWNTTWKAWVAEVSIRGTFSFTREELVNNVSLGVQTLKPGVWGYLTLYSSAYPGPGFSGKYDWAGELELSPDPFQEWTDATSLLVANSTAPKHLTSGRRRALLQQSTTGLVPVQGRVAIKESKTVVDNSGSTSGVLALDDSGDIQLVCGGNCPDMGQPQLGAPEQAGSSPSADSSTNTGASGATTKKLAILIAIAVPLGTALCALVIAAAVLHRRKKKKDQANKKQQPHLNFKNRVDVQEQISASVSEAIVAAAISPSRASRRLHRGGESWHSANGDNQMPIPAELDRWSGAGFSSSVSGGDGGSSFKRTGRDYDARLGSTSGTPSVMQPQLPASNSVAGGFDLQHPFSVQQSKGSSTWIRVKSSFAGAANAVSYAWNHRPGETSFGSVSGSPVAASRAADESLAEGLVLQPGALDSDQPSRGSMVRLAAGIRSSFAGAAAAVSNAWPYR